MNRKISMDDFGTEDTYKLYRSVYEIIHPTISKKNISNYKIMMQEDLIPLRIFYPKKISKLSKAIIYVPGKAWMVNGNKNYADVCNFLVEQTDTIVIALDYDKENITYNNLIEKCKNTIDYLIHGLLRLEIEKEKITLIGDSIGASILANISLLLTESYPRQILLYPALNLTFENKENYPSLEQNNKIDLLTLKHMLVFQKNYIDKKTYQSPLHAKNYANWPMTLVITGDLDPLRDEGIELVTKLRKENKQSRGLNIKFASHGFLNSKDEESIEECMKEMKKFIAKKER